MKHIAEATVWILAGAVFVFAQGPRVPPPEPAEPHIITVLPVTDNLDRAEEFYHHLLGLESQYGDPRARLVWYPQSPFLDDMYGVKGNTRNFYLRVPGAEMILEIEQFSGTQAKRLNTHLQDPGAVQLIFTVNNLDVLFDRLTKGGAKVLSAGGKPVTVSDAGGTTRAVLFQDFNGFFVKLVERDELNKPARPDAAPPVSYVTGITIGTTVEDTEKTARFYHEVLGLDVKTGPSFVSDPKELEAFGLKDAEYRESAVVFPDKTPPLHFFEFKGVNRKALHPLVADPNSLLLRIAVHDMDSVVARVKAAGGQIMNVSGGPFVRGKTKWLIVTDPNGIHLQLLDRGANP
jgi:predicted enzyme related to lactoylglutathione lyase